MPAPKKLTVVISQTQSKNPAKRQLEEDLAAALIMERDVEVSLVPHLYDLHADHTGMLFLNSVGGDLVVLSWLYPRAARWILDRQGVKGHEGVTLIKSEDDEPPDDEEEADEEPRGVGAIDVPDRKIYCVDLRAESDSQVYLEEIRRIANESTTETVGLMDWIQGNPREDQLQRYLAPGESSGAPSGNGSRAAPPQSPPSQGGEDSAPVPSQGGEDLIRFDNEPAKRRWYPVIDYSRCTNCMECIDFCLFGVYGVDGNDRILVEEQDNCKKGCPACSRVCPENAIIFPGHKNPAIAGAAGEVAGLKIDLSKLFGGESKSPLEMAVAERDTELVRDGREAVGMSVGIPKRQTNKEPQERDELDDLMDGLDDLDV